MSKPSYDHLVRHQRDLDDYKHNVHTSAEHRFGTAWWGPWDQFVDPATDATIVDLGVGSGTFLTRVRERMPDAKLIGFELHPEMAALARQHVEGMGIEVIEADLAVPVPLDAASVDVVASSLTFHELPHPPDLLINAARILKPGGKLVLFDIVKWPLSTYMQGKEVTQDTLDHFREHCLFTAEDLAWLVGQFGFSVDEVIGRGNGKFAQVFATRKG